MGNYWDGYTSDDADDDGIGDSSYDVTTDGTITDMFTLIFSIFCCIFQINDKIQENLSISNNSKVYIIVNTLYFSY